MMLSTFANSSSPSKNAPLSSNITPSKAALQWLSTSSSLSTITTVGSESPTSTKAAHHPRQSRKHKQQDGDLSSKSIFSMMPPLLQGSRTLYPIVHDIDDVTALAPLTLGTTRSLSEPLAAAGASAAAKTHKNGGRKTHSRAHSEGTANYYRMGRFEDFYVLTRPVSFVAAAIELWYTTCR